MSRLNTSTWPTLSIFCVIVSYGIHELLPSLFKSVLSISTGLGPFASFCFTSLGAYPGFFDKFYANFYVVQSCIGNEGKRIVTFVVLPTLNIQWFK